MTESYKPTLNEYFKNMSPFQSSLKHIPEYWITVITQKILNQIVKS